MSESLFDIRNVVPPVDDFILLRKQCGWGELSLPAAEKTLAAGLANITAFDGPKTIGFGRVIGDGAVYFYVQDLIIREGYRRCGLGTEILQGLIQQTKDIASPGASIGLMSTNGKEQFYETFGFVRRPHDNLGAGMTRRLIV